MDCNLLLHTSLTQKVNQLLDVGYDEATAHALALVSTVRHSSEPLEDILQADTGFDLLEVAVRAARLLPRDAAVDTFVNLGPLHPQALAKVDCLEVNGHTIHVSMVCDQPAVALLDNVLSAEECAALIAAAHSHLSPHRVLSNSVANPDAGDLDAWIRSNRTCVLDASDDAVVDRVERRISQMLRWPIANIESLTITHYKQGQQYLPHVDWFDRESAGHQCHLEQGGQRLATLLVYLNDVDAGGATVFPKSGLHLRPQRGAATYFMNHEPDGRLDQTALHAGAPVTEGEKWIATFWLRETDHRSHLQPAASLASAPAMRHHRSSSRPRPFEPRFVSPGVAVLDDFLPADDFAELQQYINQQPCWSVHRNEQAKVWRLTDGTPFTGQHGFYHCNGEQTIDVLNYPSGTPYDLLIDAIVSWQHSLVPVVGRAGLDWKRFSFAPWLYPAGSALSTHQDAGPYTGAFVFYAHPQWNVHWGGHLVVFDARTPYSNASSAQDRFFPPHISDQGESELLFDPGIALTIFARPNRMVFTSKEAKHMVTRVDANAGSRPRVSVAGFFHAD